MGVTVKTGGVFTKVAGQEPGLYVRFVNKAVAAISSGARSKVATVKFNFTGAEGEDTTAVADQVYVVTNLEQATSLFGAANIEDIQYIFQGGASQVIVATITKSSDEISNPTDWASALARLETYDFDVLVEPIGFTPELDTAMLTWFKTKNTLGLNYVAVFSDKTKEGNAAQLVTAATAKKDEDSVFVVNGVVDANGNNVEADAYACYIAGLIAGTAIDGSLTYFEVPFASVMSRFGPTDVQTLLAAGCLVTVMDGDQPKIEQGLTLGDTSQNEFDKIRTVRAKQAILKDIDEAVNTNYVGKITNSEDGQIAVLNAIKTYLGTLAGTVIDEVYTVELDKIQPSTGSDLYINIAIRFLDSIEYIYLTVTI